MKVAGASTQDQPAPQIQEQPAEEQTLTHEVQAGESFYAIARKYEMSVDDLLTLNNLKQSDVLSIGQELKVSSSSSAPKEEKPADPETKETTIHEVQPGDTLYGIARKYKMTVDELKQLNEKKDNSLALGEKLKVYR